MLSISQRFGRCVATRIMCWTHLRATSSGGETRTLQKVYEQRVADGFIQSDRNQVKMSPVDTWLTSTETLDLIMSCRYSRTASLQS